MTTRVGRMTNEPCGNCGSVERAVNHSPEDALQVVECVCGAILSIGPHDT